MNYKLYIVHYLQVCAESALLDDEVGLTHSRVQAVQLFNHHRDDAINNFGFESEDICRDTFTEFEAYNVDDGLRWVKIWIEERMITIDE